MKVRNMPTKKSVASGSEPVISINQMVLSAADIVSPVWPLKTFIAVNPLQGLEHLPFEKALEIAKRHQASVSGENGLEAVNRELIKWCSTYFDEGQATISMPISESGFYRTFADLAPFDAKLNRLAGADRLLKNLPDSADRAIADCLDFLEIVLEKREEFLRQSFAALPGWSGYVKWKEFWQDPAEFCKRPATLVDYVAVRLVLTQMLWPESHLIDADQVTTSSDLVELKTRESEFRSRLLDRLLPQTAALESTHTDRANAQLVFCIDVRSEPFRHAIEAQGHYETLGFAGFFGLPVRVQEYDDDCAHDSCPVLLKPQYTVCDQAASSVDENCIHRHHIGRSLLQLPTSLYQWLKYNFSTPFALVEMLGPWLGLKMIARTLAPSLSSRLARESSRVLMPSVDTAPAIDCIELSQQVDFGEAALRMMGLTKNMAPIVVFCAHGSSTTNNVYASALDCGACGGNRGGGNARILASILNQPQVRSLLAERGLSIPSDTLFVAAEHNTTTDEVTLFSLHHPSPAQQSYIEVLGKDLAKARSANALFRAQRFGLPGLDATQAVIETICRSSNWAEIRPEWGLAGNAGFIVGPRQLTRAVNLEGRCFLHSYDWTSDPDGKFLTTILTAPMVVAQWINSQYMFSTLDNVAYGAGSKVTQNVTGKLGVMQGNASDLMHGLSLQSVYSADKTPYHDPLRLSTVVYAPRSILDSIIRSQDVLKRLFGNGWVTLVCIDPCNNEASVLTNDLKWEAAC